MNEWWVMEMAKRVDERLHVEVYERDVAVEEKVRDAIEAW